MRRLGHKQKNLKPHYTLWLKSILVWFGTCPSAGILLSTVFPDWGPHSIQATSGKADSTHHPTVSLLSDSESFPLKNSGHLLPAGTKQVPQSGLTCAFAIFQRKTNEHLCKPIISRASGQCIFLLRAGLDVAWIRIGTRVPCKVCVNYL